MLKTTQCTQTILGAFGSGASGSSIIRTRLLAPLGASSHASGGETSSPSQVYFEGMRPFCWNAGDFRVMAMAAFPHRIISEAAKRITASLEFRSGDTPPTSVMNSRRLARNSIRKLFGIKGPASLVSFIRVRSAHGNSLDHLVGASEQPSRHSNAK